MRLPILPYPPKPVLDLAIYLAIYAATFGRLTSFQHPPTLPIDHPFRLYTLPLSHVFLRSDIHLSFSCVMLVGHRRLPLPDVSLRSSIHSPLSSAMFLGHTGCQFRTFHYPPASTHPPCRSCIYFSAAATSGHLFLLCHSRTSLVDRVPWS